MCFKENKDNLRTINCKMLVAKRNNLIEMKVKYSRFRHNAKQTSFTSPTGPRRQGGEHEHAQYPKNDDVTSGWSCRRPENVSILSSLLWFRKVPTFSAQRIYQLMIMSIFTYCDYNSLGSWESRRSMIRSIEKRSLAIISPKCSRKNWGRTVIFDF